MNEVHAHNLLNLLAEKPMSREQLVVHFGADVRFHTCKQNGLDLDGLLEFLTSRQKVQIVDGQFIVDPARVCNHG